MKPYTTRRKFLKSLGAGAASCAFAGAAPGILPTAVPDRPPNILWLSCEDTGPHLGCYGDPHAVTPRLDALAGEGTRYTNMYTVAGVCAPNRSCIITGMYPTTLGTHHMRSGGEGADRSIMPRLPSFVRCFPEYLRDAGYYCTNNAKEDYNFKTPESAWDDSSSAAHWRNRPDKNTPFFSVFNYLRTHEFSVRLSDEEHAEVTKRISPSERRDPASLELPPYYPDTLVVRRRWANYYELITAMDYWIRDMLAGLEEDGLSENTIVFFWSDHGPGLPRQKRWLYDSGTHVPLIIRIPEKYRQEGEGTPGSVDDRMVSSLDFGPTVLNLCGLPVPGHMQGSPFLGGGLPPERQYCFGIRDRMDERYDMQRSVRDRRYLYIRNYMPYQPYAQYMQSAESDPVMMELRSAASRGILPPDAELFMSREKPAEELYDRVGDPHQVHNRAQDPACGEILNRLSCEHLRWMEETRDLGVVPEAELAVYEKASGTRYAAFDHEAGRSMLARMHAAVSLAGKPSCETIPALVLMAEDSVPAVRYWSAVGLGNAAQKCSQYIGMLTAGLRDSCGVVRAACARALLMRNAHPGALTVLKAALADDNEWLRLHAAIVLDELGERALPAADALKNALADKENKYVVRVANRALNELFGTEHTVP